MFDACFIALFLYRLLNFVFGKPCVSVFGHRGTKALPCRGLEGPDGTKNSDSTMYFMLFFWVHGYIYYFSLYKAVIYVPNLYPYIFFLFCQ